MSRERPAHVARPRTRRRRVAEIERRFAEPNYGQVRHLQNAYGLMWDDALEAERLDRQLDKLNAQWAAVGLSPDEKQRIYELERKLDLFIRAAQCHARKRRGPAAEPSRS